MGKSLKDKNKPLLALVFLGNIALYLLVLYAGFAVEIWTDMLANYKDWILLIVVLILTNIVNAQIGHTNKARLVFWKWEHPLPGSRAFTEYINLDPRIDKYFLQNHYGPLPKDPEKQNALWFKWYREFQNEDGILQVHRDYLFTRDYAGISFLIAICFSIMAFWQVESFKVASIYTLILLVQFLLVRRAARNHGIRFVQSVLAYKASSDY